MQEHLENVGELAASFAIAGHYGGISNGRDITKQNLKRTRIKDAGKITEDDLLQMNNF